MNIKRMHCAQILIIDNIPYPERPHDLSDVNANLLFEEQLRSHSDINPYVTHGLKMICQGLRCRMEDEPRVYFKFGYTFPFFNISNGTLSSDILITIDEGMDDVLILPVDPSRRHWLVQLPNPKYDPDYSAICDELYVAILTHLGLPEITYL